MTPLTYEELLKQLHRMSPLNLKRTVQLRDYANEETHEAVDFIPCQTVGTNETEWQIGFNEPE